MKQHFILKIHRKNAKQLFCLYVGLLFYIVFLTPNRFRVQHIQPNLIPFVKSVERYYGQAHQHFWPYYIGYWGNIILFLPFGFFIKYLYPYQCIYSIIFYGLITSVCVEALQLILQIGVCDIDDLILNVTGTALGLFLYHKVKQYVIDAETN